MTTTTIITTTAVTTVIGGTTFVIEDLRDGRFMGTVTHEGQLVGAVIRDDYAVCDFACGYMFGVWNRTR